MADFAPWYRREDYERIRQIMDDGDEFPPTFDEWEVNAKRGIERAASMDFILKPITFDPDEFLTFCDAKKIPRDSKARAMFGIERGRAKDMH
jgi:hypothetical protein